MRRRTNPPTAPPPWQSNADYLGRARSVEADVFEPAELLPVARVSLAQRCE